MDVDEAPSQLRVWATPKDKSLAKIPNIKYLSPQSRPLLYDIPEEDRAEYVNILLADTRTVEELNSANHDPDYYPEEHTLGEDMEQFISIYGKCPICKEKTLRQFSKKNMPVVDLICINHEHNIDNGPILWQVKASTTSSYFSNEGHNNYITIGSRNWGNSIHNNHIEKDFFLGYICLYVSIDEARRYRIDPRSFVVFPNTKISEWPYYYGYFDQTYKNRLSSVSGNPNIINKDVITWYNCYMYDINSIGMELPPIINRTELEKYNDIQILESIYLTKYLGVRRSQRLANIARRLKFGGSIKYKIEYTY